MPYAQWRGTTSGRPSSDKEKEQVGTSKLPREGDRKPSEVWVTVEDEATMRGSGSGGVTLPQPSSMGQAGTDAEAPLGDVLVGHWEHIKPQRQKMQGSDWAFPGGFSFCLPLSFYIFCIDLGQQF